MPISFNYQLNSHFDSSVDKQYLNSMPLQSIPIFDPSSRLFGVNIVFQGLAVFLICWALGWPYFKNSFKWRYWFNKSAKTDYFYFILNFVLKVFLFSSFLDLSFFMARLTYESLSLFGELASPFAVTPLSLLLVALVTFVLQDALSFLHHMLMHRIPLLWKIHKVHHTATVLNPITLFRVHPLESAMVIMRNTSILGVSSGFYVYLFSAPLELTTVLGVNIFGFGFNFLMSNLRHSHVPIEFGPLEHLFISPRMHQIHHSRYHYHQQANYGVFLSVWDKMTGSFVPGSDRRTLRFGLMPEKN